MFLSPLYSCPAPFLISLRLVTLLHLGKHILKYVFLQHYYSSVQLESSGAIPEFTRLHVTCMHQKPFLWWLSLHNWKVRLMSTGWPI